MKTIDTNLAPLSDITTDDGRYAMNGIHLEITGDEYRATATDSVRMVQVTGAAQDVEEGWELPGHVATAPNGQTVSLVPAKEWKKAMVDVAKQSRKTYARKRAIVSLGEQVTTIAGGTSDAMAFHQPKNVEGRFPNVAGVLQSYEESETLHSVCFDAEKLGETLLTMAKLLGDDNGKVKLEFKANGVVIRGQSTEQKVVALVCNCK